MIFRLQWEYLHADEKVAKGDIESFVLMGELSLDGTLQPVKGVLPIALQGKGGRIQRSYCSSEKCT